MGERLDEDQKPSFEILKTMVTLPEIVEMLGLEMTAGDKIISPYNPTERTPSCHIYEDHFFCYATGKGGDAVDLVQAVQPELKTSRILWLLWNRALKVGKQPGDVERQAPRVLVTSRLTQIWRGRSGGRLEEWEDHLGVSLSDVGVKAVDGVLWVAHSDTDHQGIGEYGIKYRSMAGKKWSEPGSQFTHKLYHPRGWIRDDLKDKAIICEGESDCWAMDFKLGHRADVFALPAGAGSWRNHWVEDLRQYGAVHICTDNDMAGEMARDKIGRRLGSQAVPLRVPEGFKDARAAVRAGWVPTL